MDEATHPHDDPYDAGVLEIAHINRAGVPVGLYRPGGAEGTALYLHGGGWVLGGIDSYEEHSCEIARRSRAIVASLDYSLAPDGHHPDQIKEVMAVLRYFRRSGRPVALSGDGVGAYLAVQTAVVCARKVVPVVALALIYPPIGPPREPGPAPAGGSLQTQWDLYVPNLPSPGDPSLWLDELDLGGLPPTFIVAAADDPLRDDAERLKTALTDAGVPVELLVHPGPQHDFLLPRPPTPEADAAFAELADFLHPRLGVQALVWSKPGGGVVS